MLEEEERHRLGTAAAAEEDAAAMLLRLAAIRDTAEESIVVCCGLSRLKGVFYLSLQIVSQGVWKRECFAAFSCDSLCQLPILMVAYERSIGILRLLKMTRSRLRFPVLSFRSRIRESKVFPATQRSKQRHLLNLFEIPLKERFINPTDHDYLSISWWHLLASTTEW